MEKQKCERCQAEEYIPTHQYVKFDSAIYYLCSACWDLFRTWYFRGARAATTSDTSR